MRHALAQHPWGGTMDKTLFVRSYMKILIRVYAIVIIILGIYLFYNGIYGLYKTDDFSSFLKFAVIVDQDFNADDYDANDWKVHWILILTTYLIYGLTGIVGGIGLLLLKQWAANLLIILFSLNLLIDSVLYFGELYRYAFERIELNDLLISVGLAVFTWAILSMSSSKELIKKQI